MPKKDSFVKFFLPHQLQKGCLTAQEAIEVEEQAVNLKIVRFTGDSKSDALKRV